MVTIKDIAREVGVSPSTVSRALSDSPLISEKTKRRVRKIAQKLGYERNELARGLVKGSSGAVGLLVANITNSFFANIAHGVAKVAHRSIYGVILCNTADEAERESSYIPLPRRKRVDGLILTSVTMDDPDLRKSGADQDALYPRFLPLSQYRRSLCGDRRPGRSETRGGAPGKAWPQADQVYRRIAGYPVKPGPAWLRLLHRKRY